MARTSARRREVLVLGVGNACRSIMAEALINRLVGDRYRASSAGSRPIGEIDPKALETLRRHRVPVGSPRSESWDAYAGRSFDYVITIGDELAEEELPAFRGRCKRKHWSVPDPSALDDVPPEAFDAVFDAVYELLAGRIELELR